MNKRKKIGIRTLFFLSCIVFLFSGYMLLRNAVKYMAATDTYQALRTEVQSSTLTVTWKGSAKNGEINEVKTVLEPLVSMDFSSLLEINPEIVAWIRIEGTNIDYPVMQTVNNIYYLTHMYNGEYNNSGSIFMDYRCNADFSDKNTVFYGHHMRNSTMFGDLEKYKSQEFYDYNPNITIFTPEGDFVIELISGTVENGNYEFVRFDLENDDDFLSYIDELRRRSTFTSDVEVRADDQIICLCTCSYEWNNARYMVVGRLVRLYQQ
ncbi:MAG: class B sortase [Firmicutes bacterium]|nr:class B sortase [Bacillota bacterium]